MHHAENPSCERGWGGGDAGEMERGKKENVRGTGEGTHEEREREGKGKEGRRVGCVRGKER